VPLDVEQGRGGDSTGIAGRAFRPGQALRQRRTLPQAELAQRRAAEPTAQGGRHREAESRTHRHPQIPDPRGVRDVLGVEGVHGGQPVARHPVEDGVGPFGHDARLVLGGGHRGGDTVAVVRAVDRRRCEAGRGSEPPGQGDDALAPLVAAAAVAEQDQRWFVVRSLLRGGGGVPQHGRDGAGGPAEAELALDDAVAGHLGSDPLDGVVHRTSVPAIAAAAGWPKRPGRPPVCQNTTGASGPRSPSAAAAMRPARARPV
jgi:hypothetical protein